MRITQKFHWTRSLVLLLVLVTFTGMLGCRAFEPESVIVNKEPDTFIIGSPMEHGGGYYHFHVRWYGSDEDGQVERFAWAVTDTSTQDDETIIDEEDYRFNPALDASHLDIAEWTTKTDSIFDFQINSGSLVSGDFTLHMVSKDDYGDFDRTPARLHFFSNALGNPEISFFRIEGDNRIPLETGVPDTVGYGMPYSFTWLGSTPNIRGYEAEALALIDTVPPFDDGLFGYKWQIVGELGGNCNSALEDCWHPRRFNEATGDSFSYFGTVTELSFANENGGVGVFGKLLPSGTVTLKINSIDVAGIEVQDYLQKFDLRVNYNPQTVILDYQDDLSHGDSEIYPYYILLNDPTQEHHPFHSGDRIPDRAYVVVKALYRDDPRDVPLGTGGQIGIEGKVVGARQNLTGGYFRFSTETSVLDLDPAWEPDANGWSADTLGFLPGPRTNFILTMASVDEHNQRDGDPPSIEFDVGYPPCVQCVEVLNINATSDFPDPELECNAGACLDDTTSLYMRFAATGAPNELSTVQPPQYNAIAVNRTSGLVTPTSMGDAELFPPETHVLEFAYFYGMKILLHGQDELDERYTGSNQLSRIGSWRYQVDYDCDPYNAVKDGGGSDSIDTATSSQSGNYSDCGSTRDLCIDRSTGLWTLKTVIPMPVLLLNSGPESYYSYLENNGSYSLTREELDRVFSALTRQLGHGTVRVIAQDQTVCGSFPVRPAKYNLFRKVRPGSKPQNVNWRSCSTLNFETGSIQSELPLIKGAMESNGGEPVVKHFKLLIQGAGFGEFAGYDDCTYPGLTKENSQ